MMDLRPYQGRNTDQIEEKIAQGARGILYVLPTGGGKTPVIVELARRAIALGRRVNIEVHRRELMRQVADTLTAFDIPHGRIAPEFGLTSHHVHVSSVDTVTARLSSLRHWLNSLDLYIRDEAHHSTADNRRRIRKAAPRAVLCGATATPYRADGAGLGGDFEVSVCGPDAATLTQLGWLAPVRAYQPNIQVSLRGVRKQMGDWAKGQLAVAMNHNEITDKVVRFHVERAGARPAVVFCVSVEHAKQVADRYRRIGRLRAVAIDGTTRERDRDAALQGLADGSVDVVTSCELISEGLDVPRVACGVLLRPTMSTGLLLQQIGRTRRPDDEFEDALIIDAVGNLRDHGMPDEIRPWSLLQGVKNLERTVARPMTCQRCRRIQAVWPLACIECGIPFVQHLPDPRAESAVPYADLSPAIRAASALVLKTMSQKEVMALAATEADLRHVAQIRGYKAGWVTNVLEFRKRYRERFSGVRRTG